MRRRADRLPNRAGSNRQPPPQLAELPRTGGPQETSGDGRAYPLATLPIDPERLREKWALTHPALVTETEEPELD